MTTTTLAALAAVVEEAARGSMQLRQHVAAKWLLATAVIAACALGLTATTAGDASGHGTSSETFPPVELNGRQVTLEVSSSAPPPPETTGRPPAGIKPGTDLKIAMALIDFDSKVTLRDVTFQVRAELGDRFLFEQEFEADGGFLVFNFASEEDADITVIDEDGTGEEEPDALSYLLGTENRTVNVTGPRLADGGLYRFDVTIVTAGDYTERLARPLVYSSGISIPQLTTYIIEDSNFGEQFIRVITYYDEIGDFEYDSESREIRYSMPFEWSESNIEQSYVVHEELTIPETYGDLMVSGFKMFINDVEMPEDVVNIDDFFRGERIVHFIIPQPLLYDIRDAGGGTESNRMDFVIRPDTDHARMASVTDNGQFRVFASWEPEDLRSGQEAKVMFEVTDVFLKNLPVAVEYRLSMASDDKVFFEQTGTSTDSREDPVNVAELEIPQDVSGVVSLNFENLDGNERAWTSIPVVVDRVGDKAVVTGVLEWWEHDTGDNTEGGGGCLIATATYGSELAPQVQKLRELRDSTVLATESGTAFMSGFNTIYYAFSPAVSDLQREHPILRDVAKFALGPMLASLSLLEHANIETESDMLLYGFAMIAMNICMYVGPLVAAVTVGLKLKKRTTHQSADLIYRADRTRH